MTALILGRNSISNQNVYFVVSGGAKDGSAYRYCAPTLNVGLSTPSHRGAISREPVRNELCESLSFFIKAAPRLHLQSVTTWSFCLSLEME